MPAPIKILHLEDVLTDAELIHRELRKASLNFEVKVVDTRESYKNELVAFNPDIILSDHSLPFFNSGEALCLLQNLDINIPFILVTATVSEEFAVSIIKMGANDYILKDRPQRLPSAIVKAIETRKIEKEHRQFLEEIVYNETLMNDAETLANFGSFSITVADQTIKMSNEAFAIFGYSPGECLPKHTLHQRAGKTEIEKINISVNEVSIDLYQAKKSYTLIDRNGRLKFISAEFRIERNITGHITGIRGFLYNVTRLKAAENMLQQSEANLKTIFETTDTGYILFSRDGQIISFNQKASSFVLNNTGLALKEGATFHPFISTERKGAVDDIFKKALAGESTTYESHFITGKNEVRWYFSRWLPVTGNNNRNHGVIIVISDITERKLAEIERDKIAADLVIRNNALEQFSYIVSHNLRAPVANIIGISHILKTIESLQIPEAEQFLEALGISVIKLDEVVNDLNQILHISQQVNERKEVVYFQQLADDIKTKFTNTIHQTGATITTRFFDKMYTVSIKSFLYNIFLNLISNSLTFYKKGQPPRIHITSTVKNNTLILSFTDNGKGIDMQRFGNKIFGLYQRFDNSVEGKGMGLCIVKTLTDSLGGTVKIDSKLNEGTTVTVQLPL